MSTVLVIAARELRERSRLFIVAAAAALVPFAAALVPAASGQREMVIVTVGGVLAVAFACGLALVQGASTICSDLVQKRLSFYFSKPITPSALWGGKALAAILVCFGSLAMIALPAFVAGRSAWKGAWTVGGDAILFLASMTCVVLFLVSHVVSTMIRSRSLLVALDFVLTCAALGVIGLLLRPLVAGGGGGLASWLLAGMAIALLVILAVAPVWQLAKGRTDLRRSHAALSKFLWPAITVVLLLAAAFVTWVVSVTPAGLAEVVDIDQASAGGVFVTGNGANRGDFRSSFLVNAEEGTYARIESPPWGDVRWSRDGRVAAWIQPVSYLPRIRSFELYTREIGAAESIATGIRVGMLAPFALSDDGSRVAVVSNKVVSVHDLRHKRVLAAAAGVTERYSALFFATPDLVRVIDYVPTRERITAMTLFELDLRKRSFTRTGSREVPKGHRIVSMSGDGSRMFIRTAGEIVDGRTATSVAKIAMSSSFGAAMLGDGSVIDPVKQRGGVRLRIFTRDGALRHQVMLGGMQKAFVSAETSDGKVVIAATSEPDRAMRHSWTTLVIDRERGVVERAVKHVEAPLAIGKYDPRVRQHQAGRAFAVFDRRGKIMLLDLRSGEIKPLY